jgi:hypothetical protein
VCLLRYVYVQSNLSTGKTNGYRRESDDLPGRPSSIYSYAASEKKSVG